MSEPTREGALLELFANRERLWVMQWLEAILCIIRHEIVEFSVLREVGRVVSRTAAVDF